MTGATAGTGGSAPCGGANLQTDAANCGICGHACGTGQTCAAGLCYGYGVCAGRTDVQCFAFWSGGGAPCNADQVCTIQPNGGTGRLADGASCSCSFTNGADDVSCAPGSTCSGS